MKIKINFKNLVPILAMFVAVFGLALTTIPDSSDIVNAKTCSLYGDWQEDKVEYTTVYCEIYNETYQDWFWEFDVKECTYLLSSTCRTIHCDKDRTDCREEPPPV